MRLVSCPILMPSHCSHVRITYVDMTGAAACDRRWNVSAASAITGGASSQRSRSQ